MYFGWHNEFIYEYNIVRMMLNGCSSLEYINRSVRYVSGTVRVVIEKYVFTL